MFLRDLSSVFVVILGKETLIYYSTIFFSV